MKFVKGQIFTHFLSRLALFMAGMAVLYGQATATISGTVTDPTGATIGEAIVQARNMGTGALRSTLSDSDGRYRFSDMVPGEYQMESTSPGFQTVIRQSIILAVGSSPVVDFLLPPGQVQQTVSVLSEVSQVETVSSSISNLVSQKEMRELPLNGRNYTQLISLAPGVTPMPAASNSNRYGGQENYSVSGSRPQGQLFLLDNTNTSGYFNHGGGSGALGTQLGVDAIEQFQTLTNTYSAQFGGSGVVINASTKSGTNKFHGSAYEFIRNSAIDSRNVFDGASVPPYRQNQFGGTLGGPIVKDKAFFFANYEGFRANRTESRVATVPDAQAHNYMFPNAAGVYVPVPRNSNPETASTVQGILDLYPLPTSLNLRNGLPTGTGFITMPNNTRSYENYVIGRFDYNISQKDSFFFRYVLDRASKQMDSLLLTHPELYLTRNNYATVQYTRTISPTLVNVAYGSFVRNNERGNSLKTNEPLQWFPGEGRPDGTVSPGSGVSSLGVSGTIPFYLIPNKFAAGDDVVWTHGAHNVRTGAKVERLQENTYATQNGGGSWTFANLSNFLQGIPLQFTGQLSDKQYKSDLTKDWRELLFAFYVQDDWRIARKLTINIGLRYEPTTNAGWVRHVSMNLLDPPYGNWEVVTKAHRSNPSLKNFQPRIGLAWDPFADHKTSIRMGFGAFQDLVIAHYMPMYLQPPHVRGTQTLAQGAVFPFPLTNIPPGSDIPTNGTVGCGPCTYYNQTRTPTTYQYNFNIQREVLPGTIFSVGFVGSHSNFLQISYDWNYPVPFKDPVTGANVFGRLINGQIVPNPRLNPMWNNLTLLNGQSSSHYESLQVSVNRRLVAGLAGQFSYTFSKAMDVASGSGTLDGDSALNNPTDHRSQYGLANFHRKHNIRISAVYALPYRASTSALSKILGDWQLSGVGAYVSGAPFSPSVGFASVGTGTYTPRPDVVAGCDLYPDKQSLSNWFNINCFTPPPIGQFGNAGRNILIGPGYFGMDGALARNVRITSISDDFQLQFRAEVFNIPNHPSFANPSANLWNQGTNGAFNRNPSVNLITATTSQPRQIQFGIKILF